jgi:hypothetical protein
VLAALWSNWRSLNGLIWHAGKPAASKARIAPRSYPPLASSPIAAITTGAAALACDRTAGRDVGGSPSAQRRESCRRQCRPETKVEYQKAYNWDLNEKGDISPFLPKSALDRRLRRGEYEATTAPNCRVFLV